MADNQILQGVRLNGRLFRAGEKQHAKDLAAVLTQDEADKLIAKGVLGYEFVGTFEGTRSAPNPKTKYMTQPEGDARNLGVNQPAAPNEAVALEAAMNTPSETKVETPPPATGSKGKNKVQAPWEAGSTPPPPPPA